jgi:hypothetical protein
MDDETKDSAHTHTDENGQSYPVIKMFFGFLGDGETSGCPNEGGKSGPTPHKEKQNHARSFIQLDRVQKYLFFFLNTQYTHTVQWWPWESHTHTTKKTTHKRCERANLFKVNCYTPFSTVLPFTRLKNPQKLHSFFFDGNPGWLTTKLSTCCVCSVLCFLALLSLITGGWTVVRSVHTHTHTEKEEQAARRNQLCMTILVTSHTAWSATSTGTVSCAAVAAASFFISHAASHKEKKRSPNSHY